jgi:hypothetical protein
MRTTVITNQETVAEWRNRIELAWQKSVASVIEVGRLVKQAKEELGVSYNLLETELPFSATVAAFLIKIADHPVLSNPAYFNRLPNSYNTLYHLASIDEGDLVKRIEEGEITPSYSLVSAKALRDTAKTATGTESTAKTKRPSFVVGTLSIEAPKDVQKFEEELQALVAKYNGKIAYTHSQNSLSAWHKSILHEQSLEKIKKSEDKLVGISYEQLRMLEDAAHFLAKEKNQKIKGEIVVDGEVLERTCLPTDYKDYDELKKLLGEEVITRARLKNWCIANKVPNRFTELKSMDKELYIWEQVRLVAEKKDVQGGLKRLKDMATYSTIPEIKALAAKALAEVSRFN